MAPAQGPVRVLYTAEATAVGGRDGHAKTSDGRLDVALDVPSELGGSGGQGTNPEQLFACGYSACFHNALEGVARRSKVSVEGSSVTARVGFGPIGEGRFGLTVELLAHLPGVDPAMAETLVAGAHDRCPYSNATRGNIPVDLKIV
ncbi:MAG: organic hydroperoxide resistance protein [Chloroflexi bacterium]|nr:MAG: organic hydroperoxide resistance protein [Chloroflexota bacterium]